MDRREFMAQGVPAAVLGAAGIAGAAGMKDDEALPDVKADAIEMLLAEPLALTDANGSGNWARRLTFEEAVRHYPAFAGAPPAAQFRWWLEKDRLRRGDVQRVITTKLVMDVSEPQNDGPPGDPHARVVGSHGPVKASGILVPFGTLPLTSYMRGGTPVERVQRALALLPDLLSAEIEAPLKSGDWSPVQPCLYESWDGPLLSLWTMMHLVRRAALPDLDR